MLCVAPVQERKAGKGRLFMFETGAKTIGTSIFEKFERSLYLEDSLDILKKFEIFRQFYEDIKIF